MGLSGDVRTMDLPEILQWISAGRKTGTLHLQRRSVQKRIIFQDGVIHSSWSNDPRESLGQFLIREGRITEEQLFTALLRQEQEGRLLGTILVSEGLLSEEALRGTLQIKAEETIYDLFLWPEGRFEFKDGELPQGISIRVEMGVTSVILEGIRRVDEWKRIKEAFPSPTTTFRVVGGLHVLEDPAESQALSRAAAGKSLAEISLELRRSEFDTSALLFDLLARDIVAVDTVTEEESRSATDAVGSIQVLLALAHQRLREKRYDAAMKAYEDILALDRLNQNAKKGLIAVAEARIRDTQRASMEVPLDRVPVLRADLASLAGENLDPHEGFVLSRVNGQWDVQSILKICPMVEEETLLIFARLLERKVIELR